MWQTSSLLFHLLVLPPAVVLYQLISSSHRASGGCSPAATTRCQGKCGNGIPSPSLLQMLHQQNFNPPAGWFGQALRTPLQRQQEHGACTQSVAAKAARTTHKRHGAGIGCQQSTRAGSTTVVSSSDIDTHRRRCQPLIIAFDACHAAQGQAGHKGCTRIERCEESRDTHRRKTA
jgi:hypothetical protein